MAIKVPIIPQLSSAVQSEVRRALDSIKGYFAAVDKAGGVASLSDMQRAGIVDALGKVISPAQATTPPPLTHFAATGGFAFIMLTWDEPNYKYFSGVEIFRAGADDLGQAVKVGTTTSTMYPDTPPNASTAVTYYYWGRIVGSPEIFGPYNATAGTPGSTADDPTYALQVLTGQIKEGQLYGDLAGRINLIDTPATGLLARVTDAEGRLTTVTDSLNAFIIPLFDPAVPNAIGSNVRYEGSVYKCILATTAPAPLPTNATYWELVGAYSGDLVALVESNSKITLESGIALAQSYDNMSSVAGEAVLSGVVAADAQRKAALANIRREQETRTTAISAEASAREELAASIADPVNGLASKASVVGLQTANSTLLSAVAKAIAQTSTTFTDKEGVEHTTTVETMASSLDGIEGEYTVKIDANGVVASVGLRNVPGGSEFGVRAGKFFVVDPEAPLTQLIPFIVSAGKTIINTLLVGVATIKSAMIESLSADKLTVPGVATIWDAIITVGKITNAYIGDFIQSTVYTPGSDGWKIDKGGAVEFNGGTFRGAVVFGNGSSGYGNLSDKPDLSGLSIVNGWTKPSTTLIDGNKIYTGDAYVDTLQIQAQAVTFPVSSTLSADLVVGVSSGVWYDTGISVTVDTSLGSFPVSLIAHLSGTVSGVNNNQSGAIIVCSARLERSIDSVTWAIVTGSLSTAFASLSLSSAGGTASNIPVNFVCKDGTPPVSEHVYYRIAASATFSGPWQSHTCTLGARGLLAIGTKR